MTLRQDYTETLKRQSRRGRCLHFDDGRQCTNIIKAHSIQKQGQLGKLAESGHVYQIEVDMGTLELRMKKTGIGNASTFLGFCALHDNQIFRPIDQVPLRPDHEQIALYAYRCLCRELFVKENAIAAISETLDHPGLTEHALKTLLAQSVGHKMAMEGLVAHKQEFDDALRASHYREFQFFVIESSLPPFLQVSGLLYPHFDFTGRRIQDLGNPHQQMELITFFTAPTESGHAFCFAWHESSHDVCSQFLRSLALHVGGSGSPDAALLRFILTTCENHAFRISWWDNLPEQAKREVFYRFSLGTNLSGELPSDYLTHGCEGIVDWGFGTIHTTVEL
jgi:hypothetical protein